MACARAAQRFIASCYENAVPFVWTKAKVHHRRYKNRRISYL
jgi:hypothetical protein